MYKWLPSKGLVIVFVVVALFVALVAFFTLLQPKNELSPSLAASADSISAQIIAAAETDSDHDTLKDWEEGLRGTNPLNADTDSDGTPDGEEVLAGRNPLVAGPDDQMPQTSEVSIDLGADVKPGAGLTTTDALAINLFKNYLEKKQGGQTLTAADEQALVSAIAASGNVASKPPRYTEGNLSIAEVSSSTLNSYRSSLERILSAAFSVQENELLTLQRALTQNDASAMATFESNVLLYKKVTKDLLAAKIPRDAATVHLALVNTIAAIATNLEDLETIKSDPLIAFVAISQYEGRQAALAQSFRNLSSYLLVKNIRLSLPS